MRKEFDERSRSFFCMDHGTCAGYALALSDTIVPSDAALCQKNDTIPPKLRSHNAAHLQTKSHRK